jgi:peptidoglycan/xylan/chitin deacetylase (PgdA/CDA1 family)
MEEVKNASSMIAVDTKSGPSNIVLTYDDGPEPSGTHEVLTALSEYGVKATFFVLLSRTRLNPTLVKEIQSQGHEIALHGVDHKSLTSLNPQEVYVRTRDAKRELEDLIGQSVQWFRPPYGNKTPEMVRQVNRAGLTTVLWTINCLDWENHTDYEVYLAQARGVDKPGAIVLAHDNIANPVIDNALPVEITHFSRGRLARLLLDVFSEKGFASCSLSEALTTGQPVWEIES